MVIIPLAHVDPVKQGPWIWFNLVSLNPFKK